MGSSPDFTETADIETSSEEYARRFGGAIGSWLLEVQEEATLRMLAPYMGAEILDVGGGHGQLTSALVQNGFRVTVLGSADVCQQRIHQLVTANCCSFKVGNILALPFPERAFDIVLSYRLLPHVSRWGQFVSELSRVAKTAVLVDYPAVRSVNYVMPLIFPLKKRLEGNTRPFTCFRESELLEVFKANHFACADRYPEFFLPMVLHRVLKMPGLSSVTERMCRLSRLTSLFGSPVILKLTRQRG
jgi:2-polyprenyl-3-methyl-5-hydroxy-6-metoxy-1,4-benzoquinol methylase